MGTKRRRTSSIPKTGSLASRCGLSTPKSPPQPSFFKFPPELRNSIYELVLIRDLPYNIEVCESPRPDSNCVCLTHNDKPCNAQLKVPPIYPTKDKLEIQCARRGSLGDGWSCIFPGATVARHSLALLRTCRGIHAEATPIFYGRNSFRFSSFESRPRASLQAFQRQVGRSVRYVRLIHLENNIRIAEVPGCLTSLKDFTALRRLDMTAEEIMNKTDVDVFVRRLRPLINAQAKLKKKPGAEIMENITHLISFTDRQTWECLWGKTLVGGKQVIAEAKDHHKDDHRIEAQDFEALIRKKLEDSLGPDKCVISRPKREITFKLSR